MEELSKRSAQQVLDDHLNLAQNWGAEDDWRRILEEDVRRNVSENIVIIGGVGWGIFHGHHGVKELAEMLAEVLPEHHPFDESPRKTAEWSARVLRPLGSSPVLAGLEAIPTRSVPAAPGKPLIPSPLH